MTISANIIADSINQLGDRITTYELTYPRFILAELNTHRSFSRNSSSSRAIPVEKTIKQILKDTAMPIHWGVNEKGMQASSECYNDIGVFSRETYWECACDSAIEFAAAYNRAGYHKQVVNRLLEPFVHMKTIVTATEYDNFFYLRNHPEAQPEINELANCMWNALKQSVPVYKTGGQYHLPYINVVHDSHPGTGIKSSKYYANGKEIDLPTALKVSASCCAQVSYRLLNDSIKVAEKIYEKLVDSRPMHASPFEHQARCMLRTNKGLDDMDFEEGVTHVDIKGQLWSGNFKGWVQYRQLISNHTCWDYKKEVKS